MIKIVLKRGKECGTYLATRRSITLDSLEILDHSCLSTPLSIYLCPEISNLPQQVPYYFEGPFIKVHLVCILFLAML